MLKEIEAVQIIKGKLSEKRFQHSINVAQTAKELAAYYGVNEDKAYLAGIIHDYAKNLRPDQLLKIAEEQGLIGDSIEIKIPDLLHAPVGAYLLAKELDIKDEDILEAVRVHTLGSLKMSLLDKIIFLADMIEPSRNVYPDLERLRQLSRQDLDRAMLLGMESTIRYCLDRRMPLHLRTIEVRNWFLEDLKGRGLEK
jgi:predicted HD superfamily hydrolase involved in NAD metabolism